MPRSDTHRARRGSARTVVAGSAAVLAGGAASALALAFTAGPGGATGTTFTVDSLGDGTATGAHCTDGTPGNCTLRDALAAALDGDTIVFDSSLAGLISLTVGELFVTQSITIDGPGADVITIDGGGASRVFEFQNTTGAVVIDGLTITGGSGPNSRGNGIYFSNASGPVTLSNLAVVGNSSSVGQGFGGGIAYIGSGDFTLVDCIVSGNTTSGNGGGLFAAGGAGGGTSSSAIPRSRGIQHGPPVASISSTPREPSRSRTRRLSAMWQRRALAGGSMASLQYRRPSASTSRRSPAIRPR